MSNINKEMSNKVENKDGVLFGEDWNVFSKDNQKIIELPDDNNLPQIGTKEFNDIASFYFGANPQNIGTNVDTSEQNVDTSPQIIDLTDVEGVEMMVSDNGLHWGIKKIVAKWNDRYFDSNGVYWLQAKKIEYTYLTLQDISDGKGIGVDPKLIRIKEVNNEQ